MHSDIDEYILKNRPSIKRIKKRYLKATGETITTAEAEQLKMEARKRATDTTEDKKVSLESTQVKSLDDLMREADIDPNQWDVASWESSSWGSAEKPQYKVSAKLERKKHKDLDPVVSSIRVPKPTGATKVKGKTRTIVVIPDSQNGFSRDLLTNKLTPFHDRAAWDCTVQLVNITNPTDVVLLGDMLDLPGFSTFPSRPEHRHTTQATLAETHYHLARLALAAPDAKRLYLAGNHENRINRMLRDKLPEAYGLTAVGDKHPAMSVQKLLALDQLGFEYKDYENQSITWLPGDIKFIHGQEHGKNAFGSTLAKTEYSVVQGHLHRIWLGYRTLDTPQGPKRVFVACPGTICHTNGRVPAAKNGQQDWQQGLMVIHVDESGRANVEMIEINDGVFYYGGRGYQGSSDATDISLAIGMDVG